MAHPDDLTNEQRAELKRWVESNYASTTLYIPILKRLLAQLERTDAELAAMTDKHNCCGIALSVFADKYDAAQAEIAAARAEIARKDEALLDALSEVREHAQHRYGDRWKAVTGWDNDDEAQFQELLKARAALAPVKEATDGK